MALEIVTSWRTLMGLAHRAGQSRVAYNRNPCNETEEAMNAAVKAHDDSRDICLKADRMTGL